MKYISFFFTLLHLVSFGQEYVILPTTGRIDLTYKSETDSFVDSYTAIQKVRPFNTFVLRIRTYSWNTVDTALFRQDEINFYATSLTSDDDYIEIPRTPKVGQTWYNGDSSWVYSIKRINAELKTPNQHYLNLVELEAKNRNKKYKNYYESYLNYYCKGIGFVASVIDDKLNCYLTNRKIVK